MDGQIKSKRPCRSTFCERYAVQLPGSNISRMHGAWLVMFFLLLEMTDLDELKSKREMIMEKRMHDTCQHKYGL